MYFIISIINIQIICLLQFAININMNAKKERAEFMQFSFKVSSFYFLHTRRKIKINWLNCQKIKKHLNLFKLLLNWFRNENINDDIDDDDENSIITFKYRKTEKHITSTTINRHFIHDDKSFRIENHINVFIKIKCVLICERQKNLIKINELFFILSNCRNNDEFVVSFSLTRVIHNNTLNIEFSFNND